MMEPPHQRVDIHGNPYGFLATHPVSPLVSLHHLDYVDPIFPNLTRVDSISKLEASYKMDPGRILQKSFCYDPRRNWSISISWGYSVELYPSLVSVREMETAFNTMKTWSNRSYEPFMFNTRPVSNDSCEKPLIYFVDQVDRVSKENTRSRYKRYGSVSGEEVCAKL
ncbi:hypothetical protein PIB30_082058 [Stylosanthes scabra]|uniref:Uncharacterized protein n=1 Tax=Stylosanthes scabra TaxID=79078 RepID=A0ABU6XR68_9FABA|nr:hypothetical protein [Stylosanthes scabra]